MALQFLNLPVTFDQGVDTKTDEKLIRGKLLLCQNGVLMNGRKIRKRFGYTGLFSLVSGASAQVFGNELLLLDSASILYSYSPANSGAINKGTAYSVQTTNRPVVRSSYVQSTPDFAVASGMEVYAWLDTRGGVRATVLDQVTGAPIQSDVQLSTNSTGKLPRCLSLGGFVFVIYADGSSLKVRRFNPQAPLTFDAEVTLQSNLNASVPYFDAAIILGTYIVIAYPTSSGVNVFYLTQDGVVGTTSIGLPNLVSVTELVTHSLACLVEPTTGSIFVLYFTNSNGGNPTGLKYFVLNQDLTTKLVPTQIDSSASPVAVRLTGQFTSTTQATIFYELTAAASTNHLVKKTTITAAGTVGSLTVFKRSVGLASKAWLQGSSIYVNCVFDSTLQATYFTLDASANIVARILPTVAGGLPADNILPGVVAYSSTQAQFAAGTKTKFVVQGNTTFTVVGVVNQAIEFKPASPYQSRALGENVHFTGGFLSIYDGSSLVEYGFHVFPEGLTATPSTSGGSMADGTYTYYGVYEWDDNRGQRHRSAPSIGVAATISGGSGSGKVSVVFPTLRLTAKTGTRANVMLSIYRTVVNSSTPAVAYKVTSVTSPTFNDPTVDTVTYLDTQNDTAISTNEIIYTAGGAVPNIAPPAATVIEASKNRLFLTGFGDNTMWYSKQKVKGEAVGLSDQLVMRVDSRGGDPTAAAWMDDKLLIFKRSWLFFIAGDGPVDTGDQNTFTDPQPIAADVGCINPKSVVLMPKGVMFMSAKGIYLCDRMLNVSYIGADVEAYNSQNITSALLLEDVNQVRFATDSGVTLVYDYYFNQWSTFTNNQSVGAVNFQGHYTYLTAAGKVMQETPGYYLDDNIGFTLKIRTAWIKLSGNQSFQRVQRAAILGEYRSAHKLRVSIGYDYNPTFPYESIFPADTVIQQNYYGQGAYYGADSVYGGITDNVYQCRVHLPQQKCQAIRFEFEDVTSGTPGEAYSLSDLTLQVAMKRGLNKLSSSKSLG